MPGHFLVKHPYFQILIDPFDQGRLLSEDDCRERMKQVLGDTVEFHPSFLDPVGKRHIIIRILNNLRAVYLNARQYRKALEIANLALAIQPASPEDHKQRAAVLVHLGRYSEAAADLNFYLESTPAPEDAEQIRETLAKLRRTIAQMN
jgi:regulator of sirC expression with transglutaminase-like and TPR domain